MADSLFLPNVDQAVVDIEKHRDYCLNLDHPRGRHKARVFAAALGITSDNAELLREAILDAAATHEARLTETDGFGSRYMLDFEWRQADRQAVIRTAWIVCSDEGIPRLATCFVR